MRYGKHTIKEEEKWKRSLTGGGETSWFGIKTLTRPIERGPCHSGPLKEARNERFWANSSILDQNKTRPPLRDSLSGCPWQVPLSIGWVSTLSPSQGLLQTLRVFSFSFALYLMFSGSDFSRSRWTIEILPTHSNVIVPCLLHTHYFL